MQSSPQINVTRLSITVNPQDPDVGVHAILDQIRPGWKDAEVKKKRIGEGSGMVNLLLLYYVDVSLDDAVVFRVHGADFTEYMDRTNEVKVTLLLNDIGISPKLFCVFENGIASAFVKGINYKLLEPVGHADEDLCCAVAKEIAAFNSIRTGKLAIERYGISQENRGLSFALKLSHDWKNNVSADDLPDMPSKEEVLTETNLIIEEIEGLNFSLVFSHNDVHLGNVIFDQEKGKATLVDYELSGFSWEGYDLASFLFYSSFGLPCNQGDDLDPFVAHSAEFRGKFLRIYLDKLAEIENWDEAVNEHDVEALELKVKKMMLLLPLLHIAVIGSIAPSKPKEMKKFLCSISKVWKYYTSNKEEVLSMKFPSN